MVGLHSLKKLKEINNINGKGVMNNKKKEEKRKIYCTKIMCYLSLFRLSNGTVGEWSLCGS